MTLPALINQTQGKELETGLKKAYSVIQAALNQMSYDEGQVPNAANYPVRQFMPVFKKYFKVSKDCGFNDCEQSSQDDAGNILYISQAYKTYNNKPMTTSLIADGQIFVNDGMLIMVENIDGLIWILVDVNGNMKKPNRLGHDLFAFQVMDNGKLLPMGANGTSNNLCSITSTHSMNGLSCTYRALTDKDYFKNLPK